MGWIQRQSISDFGLTIGLLVVVVACAFTGAAAVVAADDLVALTEPFEADTSQFQLTALTDDAVSLLEALPKKESLIQPVTMRQTSGEGPGTTIALADGQSRLRLSVGLDTLAVFSTNRTFPRGLPLLVFPDSPIGASTNTFSAHARQSYINASLAGPQAGDFQVGGNVLAFFQNDNLVADDYGLLVYYAYGELKNSDWRFAAGLQQDVFNPVSPSVIYITRMYGSGNTGSYRGQLRAERFLTVNEDLDIIAQVALSDPLSFLVTDDLGRLLEDNGWPNVEARLEFGMGGKRSIRGTKVSPVRLGVSGVIGQIRTAGTLLGPPSSLLPRSEIDIRGFGADIQVAVNDQFGFAGEFFFGQGLGDYNGSVLQNFNSSTLTQIRSIGGFGEVYYYCSPEVHLHLGYGLDDPRDSDLAVTQIRRNRTFFSTLIWDCSKSVQISLEVDFRRTDYTQFQPNAFLDADSVVIGTRFLWRY